MPDFSTLAARLDADVYAHLSDPATLDGQPVRGMFTAPWTQPRLGSMHTGIVEPTLVLRDAAAVAATSTSKVAVGGRFYDVVGIEPDGTGLTVLVLREVAP